MAQNNEVSARNRGLGRPFEKGISGNPGGRPKDVGRVRELAREHTEAAISVLADALHDEDARVRISAAIALLDRGWGKPTTPVEVEPPPEDDRPKLTPLQLAREIAYMLHLGIKEQDQQRQSVPSLPSGNGASNSSS